MSLEDLKEQAETEKEVVEEAETQKEEASAPSEDFELEIEGESEQPKKEPTAEEALLHKLTRQKKQTKKAKGEAEEAKSELARLREELEALKKSHEPAPKETSDYSRFPDLSDEGIDGDREKYDQAIKKYLFDMQSVQNRHVEADKAQEDHSKKLADMTKRLAERSAKFATEHNVSTDRVANALQNATESIDSASGVDGAAAYLLDCVGEGSDRVGFHLGTNENAKAEIIQLIKEDPSGLKAIAKMTRLAEKLKPKQSKQVSSAPEPDEALEGDSASGDSAKALQAQFDATDDVDKLMQIKRKARSLGIELNN